MSKGENMVEVGRAASSIAEMVVELAATADRFGRDWRPTLAEFIQLRLERLQALPEVQKGWTWQLVPDYPAGPVVGPCICGSWPGGECLKCPPLSQPNEEGEGK